MVLKDKYFRIVNKSFEGINFKYDIELISGHVVYEGHFPGNPVSPGVFSIQMIRECCADALGRLLKIEQIGQCRFLSVLRPNNGMKLEITFSAEEKSEGEFAIVGQIAGNGEVYVTVKETLKAC